MEHRHEGGGVGRLGVGQAQQDAKGWLKGEYTGVRSWELAIN